MLLKKESERNIDLNIWPSQIKLTFHLRQGRFSGVISFLFQLVLSQKRLNYFCPTVILQSFYSLDLRAKAQSCHLLKL